MTTLRGCWISKCPTLLAVLNWGERHGEEQVRNGAWRNTSWRGREMRNGQLDRINELIWGFMDTCFTDGARAVFDRAGTLNGFDASRAVVQEIQKGRGIRLAQLGEVVRSPVKIANGEDVANCILKFENTIRDYVQAGGERSNDKCLWTLASGHLERHLGHL